MQPVDRSLQVTLHQLHVFRTVVETGGFGAASEALSLSQPTVSDHVRSLERVLAVRLVERTRGRRRIRVTAAGDVLVRTTATMLAALQDGLRELDSVATLDPERTETVAIASGGDFVWNVLTPFARAFRGAHPRVDIQVSTDSRPRNLKRVKQGAIDFAVILGWVDDEHLIGEPLASYDLALFGPPGHRLAGANPAPIAMLADERFVLPPRPSLPRRVIEQVAERAGVRLQVVGQESRFGAQLRMVEQGVGIAANGLHVLAPHLDSRSVCVLNVEGFPVAMDWVLVYRRGHLSPAAASFRELLRASREKIETQTIWNTPPED